MPNDPVSPSQSAGWLAGKVALVTGGASGIGRAVVERFVAEGARVVVLSLPHEGLGALREAHGGRVVTVTGDVTRAEANAEAVGAALSSFGRLDVFVANAGVFDGFLRLLDLSVDTLGKGFDELFGVNVKGTILGVKAAAPALVESGGNVIVTLSNAAFHPDGGGVLYTASKHALVGVIHQLAFELAPRVRVNGVAPGGTVSLVGVPPALASLTAGRPVGDARAQLIARRTPLGFAQRPEDHTGAYVLLASDQGRAMTGTVIHSDGGIGIRGMPAPPPPSGP